MALIERRRNFFAVVKRLRRSGGDLRASRRDSEIYSHNDSSIMITSLVTFLSLNFNYSRYKKYNVGENLRNVEEMLIISGKVLLLEE